MDPSPLFFFIVVTVLPHQACFSDQYDLVATHRVHDIHVVHLEISHVRFPLPFLLAPSWKTT